MKLDDIVIQVNNISIELQQKLLASVIRSSKVIIIGNGGSNSIASHIAVDYRKFLNKKVEVLSDASMITMLVNDYGADNAYSKFIEMNNEAGMLVILISSSGNSTNVVNALHTANSLGADIICLSGFNIDNKLNTVAKDIENVSISYHVNSNSYGVVENTHQIFLHSIIDN